MKEFLLDIFSDLTEEGVLWLESVEGLANAQRRMGQLAAEKPGAYFVYNIQTASILARTNTRKLLRPVPPPTKAGAA